MIFGLHNTQHSRSGVTLVEMLVVVAIMMFMLGIAAPMFRTDQGNNAVRETARALDAYIQEARAKAMATGRPCGVAFIPFENYPSACVIAQQVDSPPLYTGDTYDSTVTVSGSWKTPTLSFKGASDNWKKAGNMIRFGGRGIWYEMTGATSCKIPDYLDQNRLGPDQDFRPWTNGNWTTTYEIQAAPVSKANNYLQSIGMAEPLKVIRGAAIDLYYSGVGLSGQTSNASNNPIILMFTPTGEVGFSYRLTTSGRGGATNGVPSDTIFILCGQWDRALSAFNPDDGKRNYQTLDSYWIVIDPATGNSKIEQNVLYGGSVNLAREQVK